MIPSPIGQCGTHGVLSNVHHVALITPEAVVLVKEPGTTSEGAAVRRKGGGIFVGGNLTRKIPPEHDKHRQQ